MSLLNEALKRAEEEKLENASPAGPVQLPAPVLRRGLALLPWLRGKALVGVAIGLLGLAALGIWLLNSPGKPESAAAAVNTAPKMLTAKTPPAKPAAVKTPAPAKNATASAPRASSSPASGEAGTVAERVPAAAQEIPIVTEAEKAELLNFPMPVEPAPGPAAAELAAAPRHAGDSPEPPPAVKNAAEEAPAPAPQRPASVAPPSLSEFKVSGIMVGASGALAIINGKPVKIGEAIGRATVVEITPSVVTLDISGHRFSLGM